MSEPPKDKDQEKGDELLRRLLRTPPEPKTGKDKAKPEQKEKDKDNDDSSTRHR